MDTGFRREDAAAILARLVNDELGTNTDADAIRSLIRRRWSRVSDLAHAVHNELRDASRQSACQQ